MRYIWNYRKKSHRTALASMVQTTGNLSVICPYIRTQQIEDLLAHRELESFRVIALWDIHSFLVGASEPGALRRTLQLGGEVRAMKSGLHAKVYIADGAAMITSANLTAGGLTNNLECGVLVRNPKAVSRLADRFDREWRRAAPVRKEDIIVLSAELEGKGTRTRAVLKSLRELERKFSLQALVAPTVWTPRADELLVELTTDQIGFLELPVRGKGGHQSLLRRLQSNLSGKRSRLTRTDCERVVRYSKEYGQGGFQTRLRAIVQLAERFIAD